MKTFVNEQLSENPLSKKLHDLIFHIYSVAFHANLLYRWKIPYMVTKFP